MQSRPTRSDSRLHDLLRAAPGLHLLTAAADLEYYGRDWSRRWLPAPLAVAQPANVGQVQAIMHWASAQRIAAIKRMHRTARTRCGSAGATWRHGRIRAQRRAG